MKTRKKLAKDVGPGGLWDVWDEGNNVIIWRQATSKRNHFEHYRQRTLRVFGNCLPTTEDLAKYPGDVIITEQSAEKK